jgi:hypothetical protein
MKFRSAAIPYCEEPHLGAYLKQAGIRVFANDLFPSSWLKAVASIQNNEETLVATDIDTVLGDAYVPRFELKNSFLRNWFGELDAVWFDNVRQNVERLSSPIAKAIASSIVMSVGDYVLSFTNETREFRQPLSEVFKRIAISRPAPVNNFEQNACSNMAVREFIAESKTELAIIRLPQMKSCSVREGRGFKAWRDEWFCEGTEFWSELETKNAGSLGARLQAKTQYCQVVEEILNTATHIPNWAIVHAEDGFLSTPDIAEVVGGIRTIDKIFTKEFSEVLGTKVSIITA